MTCTYVYILHNTRIHKIPNTERRECADCDREIYRLRRGFCSLKSPASLLTVIIILYVNAYVYTLVLCRAFSLAYEHSFGGTYPRASVPIPQKPIIIIHFTVSICDRKHLIFLQIGEYIILQLNVQSICTKYGH